MPLKIISLLVFFVSIQSCMAQLQVFKGIQSTYKFGEFVCKYDMDLQQFSINGNESERSIIWSSIPGEPFLIAAKADLLYAEKAGSFEIDSKYLNKYDYQSIDTIFTFQDTLKISGFLSDKKQKTKVQYTMIFYQQMADDIVFQIYTPSASVNRIFFRYYSEEDEKIFGFGEQASHTEHKGNRVPVWVQEQGIGRGDFKHPILKSVLGASQGNDYSNYIVVPQYFTSKNRSIFLENKSYSVFDFRQTHLIEIELYDNQMKGHLLYADEPLEFIEIFTRYSGRMRALPDWFHKGAILGLQGGTEKVYQVWKKLKMQHTPIAAFWLQDWVGQRKTVAGKQLWWNWTLDTLRYPGWDSMVNKLQQSGINVLGYINPFLVDVSLDKSHPERKNFFKEAEEKGFLVKNEFGQTYEISNGTMKSSLLDLSHPECRRWVKEIIKTEMIQRGLKGWMADFAEALPLDAYLFSGEDPLYFHQQYTEEWAKLNREAIAEAGFEDDITFFMRSGYIKSPGYSTLFWAGDQSVDWGENDGLPSALKCIINGGFSGFSLNHSDIGGFVSIDYPLVPKIKRTDELLRRWIELSAFNVVFRTHESVRPDNLQVYDNDSILTHFSQYAKIFASWKFYRDELIREASEKGWPVVRHPLLVFPEDSNCWNLSSKQFMLGNVWMLAPVLKEGATSVEVYLPKGEWENIWTGELINSNGAYYTINGLQDKPALLGIKSAPQTIIFKENLKTWGIF